MQSKRRKLLQDMARNMELELSHDDAGRVRLMRALLDEGPLAQTATWYEHAPHLQPHSDGVAMTWQSHSIHIATTTKVHRNLPAIAWQMLQPAVAITPQVQHRLQPAARRRARAAHQAGK